MNFIDTLDYAANIKDMLDTYPKPWILDWQDNSFRDANDKLIPQVAIQMYIYNLEAKTTKEGTDLASAGALLGSSKSPAKVEAARLNGAKGGRPKKQP